MDNLLFYTLLGLTAYYFYYLNKKAPSHSALSHKSTQTEPGTYERTYEYEPGPQHVQLPSDIATPDPDTIKKLENELSTLKKDQAQKERTITGLNQSYEKLREKKEKELTDLKKQLSSLQTQVRDLAKRPSTSSKGTQTDELTQSLDDLIKNLQDLNNSL